MGFLNALQVLSLVLLSIDTENLGSISSLYHPIIAFHLWRSLTPVRARAIRLPDRRQWISTLGCLLTRRPVTAFMTG